MSLGSNTNLTQGENVQSPLPVSCTREFRVLPWIQVQANELHLHALIWHLRHLWHTDSIGSFVRCQPQRFISSLFRKWVHLEWKPCNHQCLSVGPFTEWHKATKATKPRRAGVRIPTQAICFLTVSPCRESTCTVQTSRPCPACLKRLSWDSIRNDRLEALFQWCQSTARLVGESLLSHEPAFLI